MNVEVIDIQIIFQKLRFTPNDQFLIFVDCNDKSVFIFDTDFGKNII